MPHKRRYNSGAGFFQTCFVPEVILILCTGKKCAHGGCEFQGRTGNHRGFLLQRVGKAGKTLNPGLFVFDHCRNFLRTVPSLQYAQNGDDDVDTTQEDHLWDCLRYRINVRKPVALTSDVFA